MSEPSKSFTVISELVHLSSGAAYSSNNDLSNWLVSMADNTPAFSLLEKSREHPRCFWITYEEHQGKKKKTYSTFTEDLWKGWELNPDCLTPYAGQYAQGQPLFWSLMFCSFSIWQSFPLFSFVFQICWVAHVKIAKITAHGILSDMIFLELVLHICHLSQELCKWRRRFIWDFP